MAERIGTDLREPLNHFMREPRHPLEREILRDSASLVSTGALDLAFLPAEIAGVLDRSFSARNVERAVLGVELEPWEPSMIDQIRESDFRLPEQLAG